MFYEININGPLNWILKIRFPEGTIALKVSSMLGYCPISFSPFNGKKYVVCGIFLLKFNYFGEFIFYFCSWIKITTMDGRLLANLQGRHTRFIC